MTLITPRVASGQLTALVQLARVLPRLVSWVPLGIALATIVAVFVWRFDTLSDPVVAAVVLRVTAVLVCLGIVYLLDDASRNITAASALTQRCRVGLRLVLIAVVVAAVVGVASLVVTQHVSLPGFWAGYALEVFTWVALGAAFALVLQSHFGMPEPGHVVSVALVMASILMLALSARWPMFALPGDGWSASHQRWAGIALVAIAVVIYELKDAASRWPNLPWSAAAPRR